VTSQEGQLGGDKGLVEDTTGLEEPLSSSGPKFSLLKNLLRVANRLCQGPVPWDLRRLFS
jgi:hypothetical protein